MLHKVQNMCNAEGISTAQTPTGKRRVRAYINNVIYEEKQHFYDDCSGLSGLH